MDYADQAGFVVDHASNDRRLPETWIFNCRDAHNFWGMILVAGEIAQLTPKVRPADRRRERRRIKL